MSSSLEKRQVIDYFIVAGLPDERKPLQDLPQKATHMKWPIIDVTVINKSQGELPPEGFECLEFTPNGHPANLNHGSVMAAELFVCFRRGWKKPPIIDLGVMYAGKDQPKYGCEVLLQTPYGRSANVNNTGGEKIYITYVRADETADCDSLAVVDICIILPGKNEGPPHAFRKIEKNLNRGMLGSDIFLCYKKSILKNNSLNFEAGVLFRYPCEDLPGCPFPQQVAMFCLPLGATIESWPVGSRHPLPLFSTFVLTGATGEKLYGAAVIFYDDYDQSKLRREELTKLGIMVSQAPPEKRLSIHQNQSICVLSRWPFFDTFRKFLFCLYRISVSGPQMVSLERHIGHFMSEVPFPSRERPRILVQLSTESVTLLLPEETPLPKSGASFVKMLMNLGPDNIISLVFYVLMEHRILIHSLRPDLLTSVAEAVVSMIFPFRWQCPYIPLCPLQLAGVLDSPTPFIIGLDSRYFDMFDPPSDITFVDLDTCTITVSEERKSQNPNILPKRPVKVLRSALEELYEQFLTVSSHPATPDELDRHGASGIHDLRGRKSLETFEMSIQEAFLCFMVSLLAGYDQFLLTVTEAPTDVATTTDLKSLFSIEGFLNSREKSQRNFFRQMMKTQYFSRFIDERCFVSDENIGLAFFDECIRKLEEEKSDSTHLLDFDETSCLSETTVFVLPPEPSPSTSGIMFSCKGFSQLEADLFVLNSKKQVVAEEGSTNIVTAGSVLRRTKQEVKSFQKTITQFADQAEPMAKCFVWICYSLWFMCLPSHILNISSKIKLLEEALEVLRHMHQLQMKPLDEVCYRILMHLCCNYKHPALAVKIYHEMQVNQIHPNAITYGFYNKAVLESDWSSPSVAVGTRMWKKLRNILIATVTLRKLYRERMLRMHQNRSENKDGLKSGYIVSNVNTEFAEKESVRIKVADQKVCDAAASVTVSAELLVKSSDCERDCNWKQIVSDPEEREDLTDNITPKSGNHSALTPVTENDPLGLFATKGRDRNYTASSNTSTKQLRPEGMSGKGLNSSFGSDILKNLSTEPEPVTSKSKSCDELNTDMFTAPSSKPLRRLKHRGGSIEARDNNAPVVSEVWQDHAKTLSQIGQVKLEDGSKSMHRTGSFGNALHSAANLFTLTYQNLRDSWSAGFSVQPATDRAGGSSRSSSGFLMPLQQSAQRTCSADNLSVELGKTTLTTKQLNNSLTGDNYGANAGFNDRTDSRGGVFEGFGSGMNRHNNAASVEAELCTQSKCTNCSNLLYDEEVMAGWTSNDSNLKTRCLCCGYNFVPMIHVNLKQFHVNKEPNSVTATDKNQECAALENKGDSPPATESSSVIISDNVQLKRISPPASPICLDDRDGNSISHRPYYRILRNLLTSESVDEVKVGLTFDDDFPQMPSSSLSSIDSGTEEDTSRSLCKEESFSVPYLSPLVLKKEMENLLELDGEDCLKKFQLINDHPIVYWNLVWFFRRLHLPSHLYSFISKSSVFNSNDPLAKEGTVTGRDDVVLVRTLWDGIHTHKEYGLPMYILWRENSKQMISENDEVMIFSKSVLQSILSCVVNHDIQLAIEKVLSERKRIRRKGKILYRSIYYDVLFLSLSVLQNDFSLKEYDVLYREACNDLSPVYSARLMEADRPPRMATICCRHLFGLLEL